MVKKKSIQETDAVAEPIALEEIVPMNDLKANLEDIKTYEGVVGYILRNSNSASIDLKDPTKIIDYAILSSSTIDGGQELSGIFELGDVKSIMVEGRNVKMLSIVVDENRISIFMEKNADSEKILRKLRFS